MKKNRSKTEKFDTVSRKRKAEQRINILLAKPDFQEAVERLRIKWGIDMDNPKREQNLKKLAKVVTTYEKPSGRLLDPDWHIISQFRSPYHQDILKLMQQFDLNMSLMVFIWKLAKYGESDIDALYSDTIPEIAVTFGGVSGKKPKIIIKLGEESALQDVKDVWWRVEEIRKFWTHKRPKFKPMRNFERDSRVYSLYEQGLVIEEISSKLLEDGIDLDYGNIRKIVSTFRKNVDLPKSKKLQMKKPKPRAKSYKDYLR